MRILYIHDVARDGSEAEAEFDTPETTEALVGALESLGHQVERLDARAPMRELVSRIEASGADLAFNVAEGQGGRFREAMIPALLERMDVAFTGSDAFVCALTMDKWLTKRVVAARGVPVARDALVRKPSDLHGLGAIGLPFPLIVKPNHEGSSMGIGPDSVVEDGAALHERTAALLARFPEGVLVEEYVEGRDVTVPFLAGIGPEGGVLEPTSYRLPIALAGDRPVYGLALKTTQNAGVVVEAPADVPDEWRARITATARLVLGALSIRDLARMDFRVRPDGSFVFLEINALPSLEPGAGIHRSAALAGLTSVASVLHAIVSSATVRQGIA